MRVYTQGSFDILHSGHINLLRRCKKLAGPDGQVIVSLLSDRAYEAYRGYPPALPFKDRLSVISSLVYVDSFLQGDNRRTRSELEDFKPDIVAVGSDWAKKDIYQQYDASPEWFEEHNILLLYFPYTEGVSSTQIKEALRTR